MHGFSQFTVCGSRSVFKVFDGSRLVIHNSWPVFMNFPGSRWVFKVFHGSRLVFTIHGLFLWIFMVPGGLLWFFTVPGWFFMLPGGFLGF